MTARDVLIIAGLMVFVLFASIDWFPEISSLTVTADGEMRRPSLFFGAVGAGR